MNKIIGALMMVLSFNVLADHTITHQAEQAVENGIFKNEQFNYCRAKAAMGLDVHQKQETITVKAQIAEALEEAEKPYKGETLPWSVVVEMQRVIRDAYRFRGTSEEFYTKIFESCVVSGF